MYTVKQVSEIMGYSVSTVRLRAKAYRRFLSSGANPAPGETRFFTEEDIAILKTIKALQDEGVSKREIRERLSEGERIEPEPAVEILERARRAPAPEPARPSLVGELGLQVYEGFRAALQTYEKQLSALQEHNIDLTERVIEAECRASMAEGEILVLKERLKNERAKTREKSKEVKLSEAELQLLREQLGQEQASTQGALNRLDRAERRATQLSERVTGLEISNQTAQPEERSKGFWSRLFDFLQI